MMDLCFPFYSRHQVRKVVALSYILLSSVFHQLGNAQPSTNETKQPEIRRGVVYDGTEDQTPAPSNRFLKSRLVQIEPELKGSPERLGSYVHFHKTNLINDTNLFVFDVKANITTDTQEVVLSGVAEFPENVKSLVTSLEILGFSNINNQIEMLPTEEFAATPIGVVVVPQSLVYNKPFEPRETMTDGILGDEFFPLKSYGDMILAHAPDGYVCYIERKALKLMSMEEFQEYREMERVILSAEVAVEESLISQGSTLILSTNSQGDRVIETADGRVLGVANQFPHIRLSEVEEPAFRAIQKAETLLETPYVWGGKSTDGIDCSGLVQTSYRVLGYNLPRDAYMQAYMGRLSAMRHTRELLQPGDLLYFLGGSGKITHTAIYIGNDQYIEAADGGVQYSSFNPEHENFRERRLASFCFGKRFVR